MKTSLLIATLLLSPLAHAASPKSLTCESLKRSPYFAVVTDNGKATIVDKTGGPHPIADLECVAPKSGPRHPDQGGVMFECSEPEQRDAGYSLEVLNVGNGVITAELSEISLAGPKSIANFVCRWNF